MAERGGAGLRSQQQQAERTARELMDLKIENAHLRERLRLRVGGDATAAELEAEAFALQSALSEAQEAMASRERELQRLETKYQQAMQGMMRLDEAWKKSGEQTRRVQEALSKTEQSLKELQDSERTLKDQLQAVNKREEILVNRVDTLTEQRRQVEKERDAKTLETQQFEIQGHELRAQLEATRQKYEVQMKDHEGATREDVRRLEDKLQKAVEDAAALKGEIHARQEEAAKVEAELKDTKAAEAATRQRLVKLTEDHATLRVHLASATQSAEESTEQVMKAESDNDRMRKALKERDDEMREKNNTIHSLEEELVQKQKILEEEIFKKKKAVDAAEQRLTRESEEMLQAQEETWSCREKFLLNESENYKQEISRMKVFQSELAVLLQARQDVKTEVQGATEHFVEPAQLRSLVEAEIYKRESLTSALEHTKAKLAATKCQLGAQKQLECENAKLRADYEKAKLSMERMATRKSKSFAFSSSAPVRYSRSSSPEKCTADDSSLAKRKLEASAVVSMTTTPRKAQRTKSVYVASRYLSSASKR
ncbi:hypothetical protein PHYBOEH_004212 [Phytophthora boehmeriae]|uniref:Uncharacterized protein n=1 Tax=Phytophthora boehmeriae TaxID=109152 RepID=A0A8T1WTQ9_9STRA|nr:hypothetical protein PHYBOEH_004212 [Phytophthora boehmeriae]